jgi:predicted phosphoadenosine phosphosulfate sulfurtransferase
MKKKYKNDSVLIASKKRISFVFDNFEKIIVSFSGGKDSTVMTHLILDEAIKRNRKVFLFFLDWECQFDLTIEHIENIFMKYKDNIIPYWIAIPIRTWNGCSQFEPEWVCWDENKKDLWIREKHELSIKNKKYFSFYYENMMFEEFTPLFAKWISENEQCANFIGLRSVESLNRYRLLVRDRPNYKGCKWSTNVIDNVWNFYPIYDWETKDDWVYFYKEKKEYNKLYDRMYQAGLSIHQMRIDEPFGDTQRRGLWLYQIIEPKTWSKMVLRVSGANNGNIYCKEMGNILGNGKVTLPNNMTWEKFANTLLNTMPKNTSEHYKNKISVYIRWFKKRGYEKGIPDFANYKLENLGKVPSWRKVCKALLRNDYWCKTLGFSPTKSTVYYKYLDLMKKRRKEWGIFSEIKE